MYLIFCAFQEKISKQKFILSYKKWIVLLKVGIENWIAQLEDYEKLDFLYNLQNRKLIWLFRLFFSKQYMNNTSLCTHNTKILVGIT